MQFYVNIENGSQSTNHSYNAMTSSHAAQHHHHHHYNGLAMAPLNRSSADLEIFENHHLFILSFASAFDAILFPVCAIFKVCFRFLCQHTTTECKFPYCYMYGQYG